MQPLIALFYDSTGWLSEKNDAFVAPVIALAVTNAA